VESDATISAAGLSATRRDLLKTIEKTLVTHLQKLPHCS